MNRQQTENVSDLADAKICGKMIAEMKNEARKSAKKLEKARKSAKKLEKALGKSLERAWEASRNVGRGFKMVRKTALKRNRIRKRQIFDLVRGRFATACAQVGGRFYDANFNLIYSEQLLKDLATLSRKEYSARHKASNLIATNQALISIVKRLGREKALELLRGFNPAFDFSDCSSFPTDVGSIFFRGYFLMEHEIKRFKEILRARELKGMDVDPIPEYVKVWSRGIENQKSGIIF